MLIEQKNLFEMQSVFLLISKPQLFVISEVRGIQNPFHHLWCQYQKCAPSLNTQLLGCTCLSWGGIWTTILTTVGHYPAARSWRVKHQLVTNLVFFLVMHSENMVILSWFTHFFRLFPIFFGLLFVASFCVLPDYYCCLVTKLYLTLLQLHGL